MGLVYETSKWLDKLWSEHLTISSGARAFVQQGIAKQGPAFAGFPADIHTRLYLPRDPVTVDNDADWAVRLHTAASQLGEWAQLRTMCARNGFAAGIAAEAMLEQLLPLVPSRPQVPAVRPTPKAGGPTEQPAPEGPLGGGEGGQGEAEAQGNGGEESPPAPSEADLRAALRRASRAARDAVESAETGLEGLATSLGFSGSGHIRQSNPADLKAIRDAHSRLGKSKRLRRIAEIAGRLERMAISKARSRVRPGVGEVHGVELGGDLSRLLPSELVGLRQPALRRLTLAKVIEGRAQCYSMEGREPAGRGPILCLLDESSSMRDEGRDVWSKAVALALLATATRQKRSWHLVAFNGGIRREVSIEAGRASAEVLEAALNHDCAGGTDFNAPVSRAIELIKTSKTMRKADVVVITDGEDSLPEDTVAQAKALTKAEGVSWFVIGVGNDADQCVDSLGPIATDIALVRNVNRDDAEVIDIINLETKTNSTALATLRERRTDSCRKS